MEGIGVKRNIDEAKKVLKYSSDEGIPEAAFCLGKILLKENKKSQAKEQIKKAADNGCADAQIKMAQLLEKDKSGGKDKFTEIARYYQLASDVGNPIAQAYFGQLMEKGKGTKKDIKGAFRLYNLSAEKGCSQGMFFLAKIYRKGYGNMIKEDRDNAINYYNKAIKLNHIQAMIELSDLYEKENNMSAALPLIKKAAELNNVYAMLHYASLIEEYNPEEAFLMVKKASDLKNVDALTRLGKMILSGIGIQRNDGEALKIFKLASANGSAEAMFYVANMYRVGQGTERNQSESRKYLKMAANAGHQKAKEIVATLPENQKPKQIENTSERGGKRGSRGGRGRNQENKPEREVQQERTEAPKGGRGGRGRNQENKPERENESPRGRGGKLINPRNNNTQENKVKEAPKPIQKQEQPSVTPKPKPANPTPAPKAIIKPKEELPKKPESFLETKLEQKQKRGGPDAQIKLANHFLEEDSKNLILAYHFMRLAAERNVDAMMKISELLINGTFGTTKEGKPNIQAAIHYLGIGVRFEHIPAMKKLADIYIKGEIVPKDVKLYAKYIQMAADAGDAEEAFKFSKMLREGEFVLQNANKADEYLKKAADGKLLEAQLIIADRLYKSKNPKSADYYEAAANNGNVLSMTIVGEMYRDGDLVEKNYKKAKNYLKMAAQKGGQEEKDEYEAFLKLPKPETTENYQ